MRVVCAVAVAVAVLGAPAQETSSCDCAYAVAVTGDSILQLGEDLLQRDGRLVDVESGRQPYEWGLERGDSTWTAIHRLARVVTPGGYLVVEDNGVGVADVDWRALLERAVELLPDDRTLVLVLPVYRREVSEALYLATARRANIMVEVAQAHPEQPVEFVRWNQQVLGVNGAAPRPELVYDGQHPTVDGSIWLAQQIDLATA